MSRLVFDRERDNERGRNMAIVVQVKQFILMMRGFDSQLSQEQQCDFIKLKTSICRTVIYCVLN